MGYKSNSFTLLVGYPEGKRQLGRARHIRDCNIKACLKYVGLVE
jgi:hypothetical protein